MVSKTPKAIHKPKKIKKAKIERKPREIKHKETEISAIPVAIRKDGQPIMTVGKRKTSVARVKLFSREKNEIIINNKPLTQYFPYLEWQRIVEKPLMVTNFTTQGRFLIKVSGGGVKSQAEAVSLGLARALNILNSDFRKKLKPVGLLSRDSRVKERKKPGLKRARRAPQWRKR